MLQGFLSTGQKLIKNKDDKDKLEVKRLMDTLEAQWKV
jgi:hypothetical protein